MYDFGIDDGAFITKKSNHELQSAKYIHPTAEDNQMHSKKYYSDTDRGMKRVIGANYFLKYSNCDWFWSLTDDVLIDLDALNMMMNEINSQYDTEKDFVIKGQLYTYKNHFYPQGGAGFLMSKAAARKFVTFGVDWAKKLSWPDDIFIHQIIEKLNISFPSVMSPYVFGFIDKIEKPFDRSCDDFEDCAAIKIEDDIFSSPLTPMKRLAVVHYHHHNNRDHIKTMNYIKELKKCQNLYYYTHLTKIKICKKP